MLNPNGLPLGTKVRVVFEGTVEDVQPKRTYPRGYVGPAPRRMVRVGQNFTGDPLYLSPAQITAAVTVEQTAPEWQSGDVIVVTFAKGTQAPSYTYVRGVSRWVGERTNGLTDREVDALYREGKARHIVRNGHPVTAPAPF